MAVDPSIPLQARRPEFMTPQQAISLQALTQNMYAQRVEIQQRQQMLQKANALQQILMSPTALDAQGNPTEDTRRRIAGIDPEYYRKMQDASTQRAVQLSQLQSAQDLHDQRDRQKKKDADEMVLKIDESSVAYVQPMVDQKMPETKVNEEYLTFRRKEIERLHDSGLMNDEQYQSFIKTPTTYRDALARVQTPKEYAAEQHRRVEEQRQAEADARAEKHLKLAEKTAALGERRERRMEAQQAGPPLTDEALDFAARQYLLGNQNAATGYARSPAMKAKLMNRVAEIAAAQGMSPEQVNTKLAEFEGFRSGQRTLGGRGANLSIAGAELDQFVPIAQAASDKVPRTEFKGINQLMRIGREQWSPEQAAFEAANRSVINAFAQLASRGVPTVHNTEEAEKMLNTAQTPEQYTAVLKQLQTEARGALKAIQEAQGAMRGEHPQKIDNPMEAIGFPLPPTVPSNFEPGTLYQTPKGVGEFTGKFSPEGRPIYKAPTPKNEEEYNRLPKGNLYFSPDGKLRTKQ